MRRIQLKKERKTIKIMINKYCRHQHNTKKDLCEDCSELFEYANNRLDFCPFGEKKHVCAKCPIHCYKHEMREKIRAVMRYSGPRMIYSHPILGFSHLFHKFRKVKDISKKNDI